MSDSSNTRLLERAAEMIDYWTDKTPAKVIEADIQRNDMESLWLHVAQAEGMAAQEEFENYNVA